MPYLFFVILCPYSLNYFIIMILLSFISQSEFRVIITSDVISRGIILHIPHDYVKVLSFERSLHITAPCPMYPSGAGKYGYSPSSASIRYITLYQLGFYIAAVSRQPHGNIIQDNITHVYHGKFSVTIIIIGI